MKRRLIVLRHAKSSWKSDAPTDFDRPLNKRGRKAAPKVGARLVELGWCPEHVITSGAVRARATVEGMRPHLADTRVVEVSGALYEAGELQMRAVVRTLPAEVEAAMLVGHNPTCEEVVEWLTGESVVLKTANAALLAGAGDTWADAVADPASWTLVDIIRSREL